MTKFALLLALSSSLLACNRRGDGDLDDAELAADSTSLSQSEASLLASVVEGTESATAALAPATPEGVATHIATHAPQRFSPAGCATATRNGAQVSLVFANCTGPRGLRTISGTLAITASAGGGGAVAIAASATDMQIGQATLDIHTNATYSVSGSTAMLAVMTTSTGTGPLGNDIIHDGNYTATWTPTCVAIDGAWSTSAGERSRSTTADLMRCLDECPSGSVTRTTVNGRVIELSFDGTSTARWSTSAGRSGTFQIACGL